MSAEKQTMAVMSQEDIDKLGHLVDYLHGLDAIADPGETGGDSVTILREGFRALIRPASEGAEALYCKMLDIARGGNGED